MNSEDFFIQAMSRGTSAIGDDGALKEGLIYSKDAFFENVHFKRSWMSLYQIAQKAMMVNISDAIAMNAKPLYALLSVAMPKNLSKHDMQELAQGFLDTAASFGMEIIGGDTIANTKLDITVTVVSKSARTLYRSGLKKGDLIAYTGKLGNAKRHLKRLMNGETLHKQSRFHSLHVRDQFVYKSRRVLRCGMDISDGLFSDLEKLSRINRCAFHFDKAIGKAVGCSGEEYEMLVGCSPRHKEALKRYAAKTRTPITFIATVGRGRFVNRCKAHHF